jgi:hypothetical protein
MKNKIYDVEIDQKSNLPRLMRDGKYITRNPKQIEKNVFEGDIDSCDIDPPENAFVVENGDKYYAGSHFHKVRYDSDGKVLEDPIQKDVIQLHDEVVKDENGNWKYL